MDALCGTGYSKRDIVEKELEIYFVIVVVVSAASGISMRQLYYSVYSRQVGDRPLVSKKP